MADPFTMAAIGIGSTMAGSALGAFGAEQKGAADQAMYGYQANVARLNQKIALQNAAYAQEAGGSAALQKGREVGFTIGRQAAAQGASGIDVNTGSAAAVRESTRQIGVSDESLIRTNYARRAYGYETEAAVKGTEAGALGVAGTQAGKAADISALGSLIGGAASVSSKWSQYQSNFG